MSRYSALIGMIAVCNWTAACGGSAIDLDRRSPPSQPAAGAAGVTETSSVRLSDQAWPVAADDSRVYWQSNNRVESCVFADCSATRAGYGNANQVIGVSSKTLFFATEAYQTNAAAQSAHDLFGCPTAGCAASGAALARDPSVGLEKNDFEVDAQAFYWASSVDIYRCPLAGCGDVPERVAARLDEDLALGDVRCLELEGDSLYWFTGSGPDGGLYFAPKDGSRPAQLSRKLQGAAEVTIHDGVLYWIGDSKIQSCPLAHCDSPPALLVTTEPRKVSLTVDDRGLLWLEQTPFPTNGFSLYSCPLSGCAAGVEPKRVGSDRIFAYVASPDYVYWGEYDQKTASGVTPFIFRAPKPARSGE